MALTLTGLWLDEIVPGETAAPPARQVTESMRKYGQRELVYVRRGGEQSYELTSGDDIVAAARELEWTMIDAVVATEGDAADPKELDALVREAQRKRQRNLAQLYLALQVVRLVRAGHFTQAQIAREMGCTRACVCYLVSVAECPDLVAAIRENGLEFGAARLLTPLNPAKRAELLEEARLLKIRRGRFLSVREMSRMVEKQQGKAVLSVAPETLPGLAEALRARGIPIEIEVTSGKRARLKATLSLPKQDHESLRAFLAGSANP